MIRFLVEAYRAGVVLLFLVAVLAALLLAFSGRVGFLWGVAALAVAIMGLGVSATLLSINDHLAAMRPRETAEAKVRQEASEANWAGDLSWTGIGLAVLLAAILLVVAIIFIGGNESTSNTKISNREAVAIGEPSVTLKPSADELARLSNEADANGCVPRLAAEAGASCDQ
jgi:hypothetical protein